MMSTNDDHPAHDPETLAAKVLGQDVGDPGHAGVLLRGVLGTDENVGCSRHEQECERSTCE